jgi:catechol 1,2-dioxygenase
MNGETRNRAARFDPNFTQHVIDSMGPKTSPRMREVMTSLTRHLHDFAREVELTVDEWMEGVKLMNWAGQMSDDKRNEGQLVCDIVGLESWVTSNINHGIVMLLTMIDSWMKSPTRRHRKQPI